MKKKLLSLLVVFCLILGIVPTLVFAEDQSSSDAGVRIQYVEDSYDTETGILKVRVQAKTPSGTGINTLGVVLSYDNTKLTLVSQYDDEYVYAPATGATANPGEDAFNTLMATVKNSGPAIPGVYTVTNGDVYTLDNRTALYSYHANTAADTTNPNNAQTEGEWFDCYEVKFRVEGKPADPSTVLNSDSLRIADAALDDAVIKGVFPANDIYSVYLTDNSNPAKIYCLNMMSGNTSGGAAVDKYVMTAEGTGTATYPGSTNTPSGDADEGDTTGYTATLEASTPTVNQGQTVTVNVKVNQAFNSADIKLSYNKDILKFESGALAEGQNMAENDAAATIQGADGVITIRDYGAAFTEGAAYTLTFTSLKGGNTEVEVTSASFSTAEEAETEDLVAATENQDAPVVINHKVTVNGAESFVAPGGTYNGEITPYDPNNNTYGITAKMGDDEWTVTPDNNGKFTITPVTGELVVTITTTPNIYTITWDDEDNGVDADSKQVVEVTYGTPVSFTVAAKQDPTETVDGYHYEVLVYLTADVNKTPITTTSENNTYTIAAEKIVGNITIEVSKVIDSAAKVVLTVENSEEVYYNDQPVSTITINKNENITLKLQKETGYDYKVEQFNGDSETGTELTVDGEGNFTVSVGNESVTIKVTKTAKTDDLQVWEKEYVQMNGGKAWLVTVGAQQYTGKTYTITQGENVANFFWSEKYGTYCYLVIDDNESTAVTVKESLEGKVDITDGDAKEIVYDGNVNKTFGENDVAVIDINDAQLVWNMYTATYAGFDKVDVEKFLCADVNGDKFVDSTDAVAVVNNIPAN